MAIIEPTRYTLIEQGDYSAVIQDVDEVDGEFGQQIQIQFGLIDSDGKPRVDPLTDNPLQIRGWCSARWGEKTKLYHWAKAILRTRCPPPDAPFDTDLLRGRKCDLRVVHKQGQSGPRAVIDNVFPFRTLTTIEDDTRDDRAY